MATRSSFPNTKTCLPHPLSPYAAGKLAGEHYVRVYAQTMGLDGVSLRYFNIFGPRQDPSSPYSGVISIFIKKMSQGERPTIYGDGYSNARLYLCRQRRGRQPGRDAASANRSVGMCSTSGPARAFGLLDLVAALNTIFETDLEPDFQPARAGDVRDSLASLVRISQVLGYQPLVSFQEGLRRTVEASVPSIFP